MNRYSVRIPYSYIIYGTVSGYVDAEDESEAFDLAQNINSVSDTEYEDGDSDSTCYSYDSIEIDLEECLDDDSYDDEYDNNESSNSYLPSYFLAEIHSI